MLKLKFIFRNKLDFNRNTSKPIWDIFCVLYKFPYPTSSRYIAIIFDFIQFLPNLISGHLIYSIIKCLIHCRFFCHDFIVLSC